MRRLLFDELPNAPPALARLGARAKAEDNRNQTPPDVHTAIVRQRLFGECPSDLRLTTATGTGGMRTVGGIPQPKGERSQ